MGGRITKIDKTLGLEYIDCDNCNMSEVYQNYVQQLAYNSIHINAPIVEAALCMYNNKEAILKESKRSIPQQSYSLFREQFKKDLDDAMQYLIKCSVFSEGRYLKKSNPLFLIEKRNKKCVCKFDESITSLTKYFPVADRALQAIYNLYFLCAGRNQKIEDYSKSFTNIEIGRRQDSGSGVGLMRFS